MNRIARRKVRSTPQAGRARSPAQKWTHRLASVIRRIGLGDPLRLAYARANADAVSSAVKGLGPDTKQPEGNGVHAVANIPSVHVPAFVKASREGDTKPYKNGYDLGSYRIGTPPPEQKRSRRERIDAALPIAPSEPSEVYFCAVELNGAGIRFYGDIALVLDGAAIPVETVVLDRNSYDVERAPLSDVVDRSGHPDRARRELLHESSGIWGKSLADILSIKVLERLVPGTRRLTTGMISEGVLADEDYVEVLRIGSFGADQLMEARIAVGEAALDSLAADRVRRGPVPSYETLLWMHRRRRAERALRSVGVVTKVVTTAGRVRT
jgi:hypothetical protein